MEENTSNRFSSEEESKQNTAYNNLNEFFNQNFEYLPSQFNSLLSSTPNLLKLSDLMLKLLYVGMESPLTKKSIEKIDLCIRSLIQFNNFQNSKESSNSGQYKCELEQKNEQFQNEIIDIDSIDSEEFIKNVEIFPDTHYFVYRNKKYPIKLDFFKYSSKYFQSHLDEIQKNENIQLLDSSEKDFGFTDETITDFIRFVQGNQIKLTPKNAAKYEVTTLKKHTENYIKNNHQKVAIDILLKNEDDRDFDKLIYEETIALHLDEYAEDQRLLELKVPTLYRIINKNRQTTAQHQTSKKIIEFIFKVLQKYGRNASILFGEVDFGDSKIEYVNRLLTDFSTVFDFHFINSTLLQTIYETHSELLRREEEHRNEIEKLKKKMKEEIESVEKCQREETQKLVSDIKGELLGEIQKYRGEVNSLSEVHKNEKTIEEKRKSSLDEEISKIKESIADLQKQKTDEVKEKGISLLHNEDFNGIIKYLTDKTKGNIHDNQSIEVTTSSNKPTAKYILDFNCETHYEAETSDQAWICSDFKDKRVKLTGYSIKSHKSGNFQLKSWQIQVSNDGKTWSTIDSHTDCPTLRGKAVTGTFTVQPNDYSRYVKLQQTGTPWDDHNLWFHYIEFYGYLIE